MSIFTLRRSGRKLKSEQVESPQSLMVIDLQANHSDTCRETQIGQFENSELGELECASVETPEARSSEA
jgi:hypothetical protein